MCAGVSLAFKPSVSHFRDVVFSDCEARLVALSFRLSGGEVALSSVAGLLAQAWSIECLFLFRLSAVGELCSDVLGEVVVDLVLGLLGLFAC